MTDAFPEENDPVEIPITPEIDLHTFRPEEVGSLLPEYFRECRLRGIREVRVIHGKGTGTLRRTVHHILQNAPGVQAYRTGKEGEGSWGATVVSLLPWQEES